MKNITSKEEHMRWLDEEERWSSINPYLDIEDCYEVSSYGRIRNTRYNKILDDIHHSTNGFDYIFIATKEHKPSYQHIDLIVCMTFWAWNVNNLPVHEPIIPSHIDGDTRNNRASNLEFIIDKEIWKPIIGYKDIIDGMYEISNHGNVRNIPLKFQCQINLNPSYYPKCKFITPTGSKAYDVHRIIAHTFAPGYDNRHTVVNHMDNCPINNHWRNIEWCDYTWNNRHSNDLREKNVSTDELDMIRDMLIEYRAPKTVYRLLDHDKYPHITENMIYSVKINDYFRSWKFTVAELKSFMNDNRCHQWYTDNDIRHFRETIIDCNYDLNKAYDILTNEGYSLIRCTLYSLKTKKTYKEITEQYF